MLLVVSIAGIIVFGGFLALVLVANIKLKNPEEDKLLNEFENMLNSNEYSSIKDSISQKGLKNMFDELQQKEVFKAKKVDSTDSIKALKLKIEDVNQTIAKHLTMMNGVDDFKNIDQVHKFIHNRIRDLVNNAKLQMFKPEENEGYDYTLHKKSKSIPGGKPDTIKMVLSPGYKDENGVVILKAEVITWEG